MQQSLALPRAAGEIARLTAASHLCRVTADRLPPLDLTRILIWHAAAHAVAAIPLEPAAGIIRMDPALPAPYRKRLTGVDTEIIEGAVTAPGGQLRASKPARRELLLAIGHVLATEYSKRQHLFGSKIRTKLRIEVASYGVREKVRIAPLHSVIDHNHIGWSPLASAKVTFPFFRHDVPKLLYNTRDVRWFVGLRYQAWTLVCDRASRSRKRTGDIL
jgi:hypothetical protein